MQMRSANISMHNLDLENQVMILMITDSKKWHYLVVTKLPALLRGIISNNNGDFYCFNCFYSFTKKKALKNMKMFPKIVVIAT